MPLSFLLARKNPDIPSLEKARDIRGLIGALRHPDLEIQSRAAQALGALGPAAMHELIQALSTRNKDVRLGIIEALAAIRDPEAVNPLVQALSDESSEVRWEAAIALGEIGDPAAVPALVRALKDHDKYVRYGAAFALTSLGWKPANDTERAFYFIGMQEWTAVQETGSPAILALTYILNDRDSTVRATAIRILGDIQDPSAAPALIRSLSDENSNVRWQAVLASPKCGVPLMHLPRGLSRRPKMAKSPLIAAFMNFMLPGLGYGYLGKWWGIMVFQIDITITVWLFKYGGETNTYGILFPLYLLLAGHAWYLAKKMPEQSI